MYAVGGALSDTCPQWGMREVRRISAMYTVGNAHLHMYLLGYEGGEEDLCCVHRGERSLTHVAGGGWGKEGRFLPCTQWGMLGQICR